MQQQQDELSSAVPHVRQRLSWDCGLACVEMVLRGVGSEVTPEELRELVGTASVWTVDLAFLLAARGVLPVYCTLQVGCNPGFTSEQFYAERLRDDRDRVERLFARALAQRQPRIEERAVSRAELCSHLSAGSAVAIVLVDRRRLYPAQSPPQGAAQAFASALHGAIMPSVRRLLGGRVEAPRPPPAPHEREGGGSGFTGHYILLLGLSPGDRDAYVMHDPARACGLVPISCEALDRARCAFGTDEDVLLIRDERLPARILARMQVGTET